MAAKNGPVGWNGLIFSRDKLRAVGKAKAANCI